MSITKESELYYKDELIPPSFLDHNFFENILQISEKDTSIKITNIKVTPGSKAGDHFASIMFKVFVEYSSLRNPTAEKRLVVKTIPVEDGVKKDLLQGSAIFEREIEMYTKVLPEMKNITESIGDDEEFAPKLLYHNTDPPILVFEDLSANGYVMHEGLFDFDNTIKVTKKLAKFHAISYYISDNKYNSKVDLTKYKSLMNKTLIDNFKVFFEGFEYLKEEMINWPGFEDIAKKIPSEDTFAEHLIKSCDIIPEFSVLCHGDLHVKNLMFIKNGDNIDKTIFLDYQMSFWGSPAIDLIYILYAIGDSEARRRRQEIVFIYHEALTSYLTRLKCLKKSPSLLELNIEILEKGVFELLWSVCFLPFFAIDYSTIDMESLVNPTPETMAKIRKIMYTNVEVVKMLKETLPELVYKGIL